MALNARGKFSQMIAELTIGTMGDRTRTQVYRVEFDIASPDFWLFGLDIKILKSPNVPRYGTFWRYINEPERTNTPVEEKVHSIIYADGSATEFKYAGDFLEFIPHDPPPRIDPLEYWIFFHFGVAHEVSAQFKGSPASGIVGLGRAKSTRDRPTFLGQLREHLTTPEMTIVLGLAEGSVNHNHTIHNNT
ncbi:hypothetical protein C8J57DRAFT_1396372 [Mycena rebaudengoi]|nr:hypothetical protein C8J57DRAFT_1396372 [Mycena rebaudengoi]